MLVAFFQRLLSLSIFDSTVASSPLSEATFILIALAFDCEGDDGWVAFLGGDLEGGDLVTFLGGVAAIFAAGLLSSIFFVELNR